MKVLFFSDVHGSPESVGSLQERIDEFSPELLVLLGDVPVTIGKWLRKHFLPPSAPVLYGLFFAVGFVAAVLPFFGWDLSRLPGADDTVFNSVVLEHGFQWLGGLQPSFWDAPYFYPAPHTLAYSDSHIGNLPLFVPFRAFLPLYAAVGCWIVLQFALNNFCAIWALRRRNFSPLAAAAGAYVFAFALPVTAQMGHIQLLPRFAGLLALHFADRFSRQYRDRDLVLVLLFLLWQFGSSIYLGAMYAMLGGLYLALRLFLDRREIDFRRLLLGSGVRSPLVRLGALALFAALMLMLLAPYREVWKLLDRTRPWSLLAFSPPHLSSFVLPNADSPLYHWLYAIHPLREQSAEHALFPGLAASAAAVFALVLTVRHRSKIGAALAAAALSMVLCSIEVGNFSISSWCAANVPGMNSLRSMSRVILVLMLPLAATVAVLADQLRSKPVLLALFLALTVAESAIPTPSERLDPAARVLAEENLCRKLEPLHPGDVFIYFPLQGTIRDQLVAVRAAQKLGLLTVNGYSGHNPPGWYPYGFTPENYQAGFLGWMQISKRLYGTADNADRWRRLIAIVRETPPPASAGR